MGRFWNVVGFLITVAVVIVALYALVQAFQPGGVDLRFWRDDVDFIECDGGIFVKEGLDCPESAETPEAEKDSTATAVPQQDPPVSTGGDDDDTDSQELGIDTGNGCGSNSNEQCESAVKYGGIPAYAQTGEDSDDHYEFIIPDGYGIVIGGYMVTGTASLGDESISLNSKNQPGQPTSDQDAGALIALYEGVSVNVDVTDGFYQLYPMDSLRGEFCGRYNEAHANNWSKGRVFGPQQWGSPPEC